MKMKKAFTLAEVLLVIAIIGTVSVLAVNNAVKNTSSAEKITRLRKTYDILQTAITAGMYKGGAIDNWGLTLDNADNGNYNLCKKFLVPHLKIEKDCGTGTGCWKSGITSTNYRNTSINFETTTGWYKAILANGASIAVRFAYMNTRTTGSSIPFSGIYPVGTYNNSASGGAIFVDIDGPNKGASKMGDDVFLFYITPDGIVPSGNNLAIKSNTDGQCPKYGEACTAWALYKGNQDYFKCPDSLSWTDKDKAHCQ